MGRMSHADTKRRNDEYKGNHDKKSASSAMPMLTWTIQYTSHIWTVSKREFKKSSSTDPSPPAVALLSIVPNGIVTEPNWTEVAADREATRA